MTFKSLNRRYTKLTRKMAAACCGLLLLAACLSGLTDGRAGAAGFDRRPVQGADSTPALQGAAAIASLKERGLYESLRAALSAPGNRRGDYSVISPSLLDEQKLTASDGAFADQFGQSIAVSGSTIAVGTQEGQGSAYVFERRGGSWVETQKLTASDGAAFGSFGWLVALSGSTIVVSAHGSAIGGNINQGSAHVFERQGGGWVETRKLTASDGEAADFFSYSVAISGSTIAVGTIGDDINGNTNQGSAYVFQP